MPTLLVLVWPSSLNWTVEQRGVREQSNCLISHYCSLPLAMQRNAVVWSSIDTTTKVFFGQLPPGRILIRAYLQSP